jgi:DHA1 family inner membrane transport protein
MEHTADFYTDKKPNPVSPAQSKSVVYILALGVFGIITTEFGVIGILPQLATRFHVSITQAGWLLTAFALTIALSGPFITLAVAHINRKAALSVVLAVFILSNIASIFAPSFALLLIARVLPAFFHPIFFSVAMATAAQSVEPAKAPKAVAIVFSGISVGTVLGVPLTVFFADLFDWRAAFAVSAVINLIAVLALLILLPSMPVKERPSFGSQLGILKKKQTWWSIITTILIITGMTVSYGYMAEYLKNVVGLDGRMISIAMLLFGIAGVFGNLLIGHLLTQNKVRTVWLFLAGLILVQVVIYFAGGWFYPALALMVLWGFIHTGGFLLGQTLITRSAPEAPEFSSSIFVSAGNTGFAIGSFAGGVAIDAFGISVLPLASISVLIVAAIWFLVQQWR